MINFVVRTDEHVSEDPPSSRKDDYFQSCLDKLQQIGDIASERGATAVLDNGDFFHKPGTKNNSHELVRSVVEVHDDHYNCPVYENPGNHDFPYTRIDYVDQHALGVLFSTGVFERMDGHVFEDEDGLKVRVVGVPYKKDFELTDFDVDRKDEDFLILCAHTFASPEGGSLWGDNYAFSYHDLAECSPDFFCFTPETKVVKSDGSLTNIEDLNSGDILMGRKNSEVEIEKIHPERDINQDIVEFEAEGLPSQLISGVTSDHPFWVTRGMNCRLESRKNRRCHPDKGKSSYPCSSCDNPADFDPEWVEAGDIEKGDYVATPIPNLPDNPNHNPGLARLLGYYLAEGHIINNRAGNPKGGVGWSFHKNEVDLHRDVIKLVSDKFDLEVKKYDSPENGKAIQLCAFGPDIASFFLNNGSKLAHEKSVSEWVWNLSAKSRLELLKGWISGDGHVRKQEEDRIRSEIVGATVSEDLASQIFLLALSIGLRPSYFVRPSREVSLPQEDEIKSRACHMISFYGDSASLLADELGYSIPDRSKTRISGFFSKNCYWSRVKDTNKRGYSGPVYNMRTSSGEYVAGLTVTHNCFGHWHIDQGIQKVKGKHFMNLGSMTRGALVKDNLDRIPRIGYIELEKDGGEVNVSTEAIELDVKPSDEVFDIDEYERVKQEEEKIDQFIESLSKSSENEDDSDIVDEIQTLDFPEKVREKSLHYLRKNSEG